MAERHHFSLPEWLDYLEHRKKDEIKLGLSRICQVAEILNLKNWNIPVITVAGTNGKGSTIATLEAIYLAAGYKVGSYTSPHLLRFNERIKVDGLPISDASLCQAFTVLEENAPGCLTYFEAATLAALWYFKQSHIEVMLLEVGLGGRKDATNVIDSDVAIITTIDFDHQEFLGNTKEAIGREKAGILRCQKPLVFADEEIPLSIVNQCTELQSPLYQLGKAYYFLSDHTEFKVILNDHELSVPKPNINNKAAAAAIVATQLLQKRLPYSHASLCNALGEVTIPGRLQLVELPKKTLFDVAHNAQSASMLADHLKKIRHKYQNVCAVFSALKDKDIPSLIDPLYNLVSFWYPSLLSGKRATDKETLMAYFRDKNKHLTCYNSPVLAYEAAYEQAKEGDLIVVYGSFHTVGTIMEHYMPHVTVSQSN